MKKFSFYIALSCAVLSLAGCKKDLMQVSDETILSVVGGGGFLSMGTKDGPVQIGGEMKDCVALLGGTNSAMFKDLPPELIGQMKLSCRKELQNRLDKAGKDTGLTLEDFERKDFSERILNLAATQKQAADAQKAAERVKLRTEKINAARADLDAMKGKVAELSAGLAEREAEIPALCAEFQAARKQLTEKRPNDPITWLDGTPICEEDKPFADAEHELADLKATLDQWVFPSPDSQISSKVLKVPSNLPFELRDIDDDIEQVKDRLKMYQDALAE